MTNPSQLAQLISRTCERSIIRLTNPTEVRSVYISQPLPHILFQSSCTISGSNPEVLLPPRAHLAMSEDILVVKTGGQGANSRNQGCCYTSHNTQGSPQPQRVI